MLVIGNVPETTLADIVISSVSVVGLTVLAAGKVRIAWAVPSAALRADGFLSGIGAAQAFVVLAGIVADRLLSWRGADNTAALVVGLAAVTIAVRSASIARRDLLHRPAVAIGITEEDERTPREILDVADVDAAARAMTRAQP